VFFKSGKAWRLEGCSTVARKCSNCGNTTEHVVVVAPRGPQLGLIFLRKPLLGMRKYFLVCPVCSSAEVDLTKEQAYAMKGKMP
jgi:hypothetical protein